ncbi:MAG TPA: lysophospholipid acyltransferase family protein [Marinobacter sp.]|jgi:1-acyl-sn-glycerol-3-phosphate acyltransferase
MLKILKAVWILFWASLLTLILFLPIVIAALAGRNGNAAFIGTQVYAWCILKLTGIRLRVTGRENINPTERYVILSNHASYFDPPALVLALGLQYRWVIKQELRSQ